MVRGFVCGALIVCLGPAIASSQEKGVPAGVDPARVDPARVDPAKALAQMQQQLVQQFDVNRNGVLDGAEQLAAQEAMRQHGLNIGLAPGGFAGAEQFNKMFDRDGDGKLNQMEAFAAQQAFQRMRGHGARGGVRSGGSAGGFPPAPVMPVNPAADKKGGKVSPLIKRFDKDGDGKLNADEKAAAQAELKKDKGKDKEAKGAEKKGK